MPNHDGGTSPACLSSHRTPAQRRRYRRRTRKWAVEAGQHILALVRPAPISRDVFLRRRAFWHVSGAALVAPTVTARGTNEFACQVSEADFVRINLTGCHQQNTTYRIQQVIDNVVDVRADLDLLPVQSSSQPNFSMSICDQQTNLPLPSSQPAPVSVSGLPAPTPAERASPASDHKIGFDQAAPIRDYLLFFLTQHNFRATGTELWEWYSARDPVQELVTLQRKQFFGLVRILFDGMIQQGEGGERYVYIPPHLRYAWGLEGGSSDG